MSVEKDTAVFEKPVPRGSVSPSRRAKIQVQNRRREYLQRHPSYFESLDHELADPILYERLIKRFQTAAERAEEGKAKGYGRTLEASLIRGETNLANMSGSSIRGAAVASSFADLSLSSSTLPTAPATSGNGTSSSSNSAQAGAATAEEMSLDRSWDQPVSDKEEGQQHWRDYLEFRFVHGLDDEFDYSKVDEDEDLDALHHKDAEDVWYDEEEPSWVDEDGDAQLDDDGKQRKGETGIQDY